MGKRTVEFVLGLIGGIFGFFGALIAFIFTRVAAGFGGKGTSTIIWLAILFSIIGIVGAALVKSKTKLGGWMMVISAIGGVISVTYAYAPSFILLIIAGLMTVIKKGESK